MSLRLSLSLLCLNFVFLTPSLLAAELTADTVILSQGDVKVTMADVDAYLQRMPEENRAGYLANPKRINQMLQSLLSTKALARQARELKIDQRPAVQNEIALDTDKVLAQERITDYKKSLTIPDFSKFAKEQYEAHKEKYTIAADVDVQHILIMTGDKHSDADSKALANKVRMEAIATPANFDALVAKYSEDPSKANNLGRMRDATSSQYAPPFAEAAGALKKENDISPVVHTKFGYHVLKLISRHPARQKTFDEVKPDILAELKKDYVETQTKQFLADLGSQKVDFSTDVVDSLRTRYLPGDQPSPPAMIDKPESEQEAPKQSSSADKQ